MLWASSPVGSTVLRISFSRSNSVAFFKSWRTSSSSASRIIWSMLPWNSRDSVRALRAQKPATRSARGRSFGPITRSATIPISINSGQPISNSIGQPTTERQHHTAPQGARFISERRGSGNRGHCSASFLPNLRTAGLRLACGPQARGPITEERLLVDFVGLRFVVNQLGSLAEHRRADVEEAGGAQLVDAGQHIEAVEPEMREKTRSRHPIERAARAVASAARPHPACLHQPVEGAARQRDAPDCLDLGARRRLVIGNDRQRLDGGPRQPARHDPFALQERGEVWRGTEGPAAGEAYQVHSTLGVALGKLAQQRLDIG